MRQILGYSLVTREHVIYRSTSLHASHSTLFEQIRRSDMPSHRMKSPTTQNHRDQEPISVLEGAGFSATSSTRFISTPCVNQHGQNGCKMSGRNAQDAAFTAEKYLRLVRWWQPDPIFEEKATRPDTIINKQRKSERHIHRDGIPVTFHNPAQRETFRKRTPKQMLQSLLQDLQTLSPKHSH